MAIIYSYPEIGTIAAGDLMPITDVSDSQFPTKSVTLSKLSAYFQSQQTNILNISSTTGTAGSVSLPTETLNFEGGFLINAAIDPDGGQTVKFDLDATPNPGADPNNAFTGDLLVAQDQSGRLQFQTIAVGCQLYAMAGASKQLAMAPINLTGQAGGGVYFKGSGGSTGDPLRIDTIMTGVDGGVIDVAFDLVTPDAMINKLGTFVNPSSITVGKGGIIDDIVAGSADPVSGTGTGGYPAIFSSQPGEHSVSTISGISFADAQTQSGYVPGMLTSWVGLSQQRPGIVPTKMDWQFYDSGGNQQGDGGINQQGTMTIGATAFGNGGRLIINQSGFAGATNHRLNVGGDARIEGRVNITAGGLCISDNPSGVSLDNTSMVIGSGDNDIISGSDHSMIVGKANQLQKTTTGIGSDQSAAIGSANVLIDATNSLAVGRGNSLIGTGITDANGLRSQVIGLNNQLKNTFASIVIGGQNEVNINEAGNGQNTHVLGYDNTISGYGDNIYAIGNKIDLDAGGGASNFYAFGSNIKLDRNVHGQDTMVIGIRNKATLSYTPATNTGLGYPALIVGAGSTGYGTHDALIITKQTGSGTNPGSRTILPDLVNFNFADDTAAAAGGIPVGGLYHSAGVVKIRLT